MQGGMSDVLTVFGVLAATLFAAVGAYHAGAPVWVVTPLTLFVAIWGLLLLDPSAGAARVRQGDAFGLYTATVDRLLELLGRMMAPKVAEGPVPGGLVAKIGFYTDFIVPTERMRDGLRRRPFSWPVADTALKLAVIYPLLALLIQWTWTGDPTGVAGVPILPGAVDAIWRYALTGPVVLAPIARIMAAARGQRAWDIAAQWLINGAVAGAVVGLFAVTGAGAFAVAGAVAVAVAGAFVFAGAVAIAVACAFAVAFAVTVAIAFAVPGAGAVAGAVSITIPGAGAFAVAAIVGRKARVGRGLPAYGLLVAGLTAIVTLVLILAPRLDTPPETRILIFAFALLPVVNALFDYLSYGLTLTLMAKGRHGRRGLSGRILLFGLGDALAAVAILIGLGLALTLLVAFIDHASGVPLFDLPQVFADLRDPEARGAYAWLVLACLTTLVPTLVHLCIAALSASAWFPAGWREAVARRVEGAHGPVGRLWGTALAAVAGTGCLVLFLGAPLAALGFLSGRFADAVPLTLEGLGLGVLWAVEGLAWAVGALPAGAV
jgi:hypothetical protein